MLCCDKKRWTVSESLETITTFGLSSKHKAESPSASPIENQLPRSALLLSVPIATRKCLTSASQFLENPPEIILLSVMFGMRGEKRLFVEIAQTCPHRTCAFEFLWFLFIFNQNEKGLKWDYFLLEMWSELSFLCWLVLQLCLLFSEQSVCLRTCESASRPRKYQHSRILSNCKTNFSFWPVFRKESLPSLYHWGPVRTASGWIFLNSQTSLFLHISFRDIDGHYSFTPAAYYSPCSSQQRGTPPQWEVKCHITRSFITCCRQSNVVQFMIQFTILSF